MKRKTLALTLILAFLFSVLAVTWIVKLGTANAGLWLLGFPTEAVKTPPEIIFQSPKNNQTYDSNSLWLNFTIVKPEAWFFVANANYISPNNYIYVNITSVSYTTDGITSESIPVRDITDLLVEHSPSRTLDFSTNLTLPEGAHNLTVSLQCDSYYWGSQHYLPSSIQINFSSEVVDFTTASELSPSPSSTPTPSLSPLPTATLTNAESFPTTLVGVASGASVLVVGIGLLVYFKKRKR